MKEYKMFLSRWMITKILVIVMTLLPCMGQAYETPLDLSSQYKQSLQQLLKTDKRIETQSNHNPSSRVDYLLKKLEYYRFLDAYIKDRKEELAAEGISVSVISKDDLLFLKGYGLADKEAQKHVTPFTLFGVGSVSKLFTGIAIMQLVEKGKIDLDAPLENYIPGFGYKTHYPDGNPITVRTLMTHQSGLVGDILKGWGSVTEPAHNFRELIGYFNDEYLAYPPGYISTYSNSAVALLGIVIEEVSGIEFKTYVKQNICNPLGMLASNFSSRDYMHPILAKSYDSEGVESPFMYIRDEPAGSFISNSLEMSLFMRMILNGGTLFGRQILKQSTLEKMFIPQNSNVELDFPQDHGMKWGLSWMLNHSTLSYAGKYAGHGGDIPSYHTQLHTLPEQGLAVIVQTNSDTVIASDVADMAMIKALEIFRGIQQPGPSSLPPLVALNQNHIQQMAGNYATNDFGLLSIYPKNDSLFAVSSVQGAVEVELKPHTDNWFSLYSNNQPTPGFENLRITVKNGERERFVGIQVRGTHGAITSFPEGSEYEIPEELSPEWTNRIGQYRIIDPDFDIIGDPELSIQLASPGVLIYTVQGIKSTVLDTIYEDEAISTGRGRNMNETLQVVDCNGEPCLYSLGYLLKKQPVQALSIYGQQATTLQDLKKIGKEIEKKLIRGDRFPALN